MFSVVFHHPPQNQPPQFFWGGAIIRQSQISQFLAKRRRESSTKDSMESYSSDCSKSFKNPIEHLFGVLAFHEKRLSNKNADTKGRVTLQYFCRNPKGWASIEAGGFAVEEEGLLFGAGGLQPLVTFATIQTDSDCPPLLSALLQTRIALEPLLIFCHCCSPPSTP